MKRPWLAVASALLLTLCPLRLLAEQAQHQRELAPDQPGEEEDLNRELWEFVKKTPYESIRPYIEETQARANLPKTAVLPNGWAIAPAGAQIELGRLPYEAILYRERLVVLNTGYYGKEPQTVSIIDLKTNQVVKTLPFKSLFPSATLGQDGDLYISGGFERKVYRVNATFETVKEYSVNGYAGGLAPVDRNHLAVAYLVADNAQGKYSAGQLALLNTDTGKIEREVPVGYFPYTLQNVNNKLYLTVLGEDKVFVYDAQLNRLKTLAVGRNPQSSCSDGKQLYVVNSASDDLSIIDPRQDRVIGKIDLHYQDFKYGSSPTSCAIEDNRLYVTQAELNAVAVFDKTQKQRLGLIPTGWYPTKVILNPNSLSILSAKGIQARRPNPEGPQPIPEKGGSQYVLTLLKGSLSLVPKTSITTNLAAWTKQVEDGSPLYSPKIGFKLPIRHIFYLVKENRTYDQILGDLGRGNGDPQLALFGKEVTPNHHHLAETFVTLDNFYVNGEISVLGHSFTSSGYASPFLEWLGNMRYSERYKSYPFGIVPATFSPAYLWNGLEAKNVSYRIYGEPYYLFTRAYQIFVANYGAHSELAQKFYVQSMNLANETDRGQEFSQQLNPYYGQADTPEKAFKLLEKPEFSSLLSQIFVGDGSLAKALAENLTLRQQFAVFLSHYPLNYHYYDLNYSDLDRFNTWKTDFERQVQAGNVAALHYIWLPNDHTAGTASGFPNPYQLVAQNDAALGKIIETISNSPIWKESLILVTEDDAQNGPDHVDATRTVALAASPYVKRGSVVSDSYDQLGLLRTIEIILGLDPLNLNDGLAAPMFNIFTEKPDFSPYVPPMPSTYLLESDQKLYQQNRLHLTK